MQKTKAKSNVRNRTDRKTKAASIPLTFSKYTCSKKIKTIEKNQKIQHMRISAN